MDPAAPSPLPYMTRHWMGLRWTAWMPLMAAHPLALAQLPYGRGVYRIRRAGRLDRLEWIGWDGRGVREVVERLSRQVHMPVQPYDDPRSPAALLWGLRQAEAAQFEVSGAALPVDEEDGLKRLHVLRAAYTRSLIED